MARGTGTAPCIAIAVQGSTDRFIGPAFRMSDDTELERYVKELRARPLAPESISVADAASSSDPSGRSGMQGSRPAERLPLREALAPSTNTAHHTPRVNARCVRRSSRRRS